MDQIIQYIKNNIWIVILIVIAIILILILSIIGSKKKKLNKNNEVTNEDLALISSQVLNDNPELQNLDDHKYD